MRGLDDIEMAQTMMDGMRIYYKFLGSHSALGGKTPAQEAKVATSKEQWMSFIKKARKNQRFETSS